MCLHGVAVECRIGPEPSALEELKRFAQSMENSDARRRCKSVRHPATHTPCVHSPPKQLVRAYGAA